ncbi:hypothetical protein CHGG_03022 [Chaetomium globosum CBS 148.51]|uniref:SH3 domain-containing protein n=1 Tax=Chaetomium globosum (strain ATCC 6205 / CBS 148.51 / DSM 1962 / NBRC 6347 / NRRL 1970) TaxID=306901 RepID=Q2H9T2_CHAGB|nr:uncharacterized protein CHGG_03022 [Chaetomium globosum CBS 148.51]EAQ91087.1 hypothetical protein CHGG_03022 [Chaetomium globosum CBS 148.51]
MTRPEIIRADTIDLQDHETPSAQKHQGPPPDGSFAPHQAETLREVAAETAEENLRSPGVSWYPDHNDVRIHTLALDSATSDRQNGRADAMRAGAQEDALAVAQNGGHEVDDGDLDGDAEVDMDDDMMDKISSSPSIEDGGSIFALSALSPSKAESLPESRQSCTPATSPIVCDERSSSPYLESPEHLPLGGDGRELCQRAVVQSPFVSLACRHHHHDSELVPNTMVTDDAPSERCPLPDDFDFDDSLPWADEEDGCDFEPENSNNGDGVTKHELRERGVDNENNDVQEDNATSDLTIPYEPDEDDDDGDFSELSDSRFIDSGWGGECLQDTEDIDFDFVYALHTFVATVEGQANATKGDTMVLLDDSNSYWWLLSASMLGDQQDKARNPIRSAMKRRKTKNVQFAAPTYVDYSDIDYSTEEEDADGELAQQQGQQSQQSQQSTGDGEMQDETAKVEPLKPKSQSKQTKADSKRQEANGDVEASSANKTVSRAVEETAEVKADGPKKSSDGTVRDSFFKDDTVETKKITLTPNLLRDDNAPRTSSESRDVKPRPSLDKLDKDSIFSKDDKKKKKEKEKDKKAGGLRGFFSRKDKKAKGDDDDDSFGKRSMDADAPEKDMEEDEPHPSPEKAGPQRNPSKLQKHPRGDPSPTRRSNSVRENNGVDAKPYLSEGRINNVANVPPASMRLVESSPKASPQGSPRDQRPGRDASPVKSSLSKTARPEPRPTKSAIAKPRAELDDSETDEEIAPEPTRQAPIPEETTRQEPRAAQDNIMEAGQRPPAAVQPTPAAAPVVKIPAQTADQLSDSPVQSATPSPELVEHEDADMSGNKTSTTPSTTRSESWDDAGLRAFFDSGSDVRDLLLVVYDKNTVDDIGPDHHVAASLFREQNAKLAEITTRLDDMLGDWLARKQRLRGAV